MKPVIEDISSYLTLQNIKDMQPDTSGSSPLGFVDRGRGGTTFLNTGETQSFLALIEFTPQSGPRGRHKHMNKRESIYIISGTLKGRYWLENESCAQEYIHPAGTLITLESGLFHIFECMGGPVLALEFSPESFDLKDHHYPESM